MENGPTTGVPRRRRGSRRGRVALAVGAVAAAALISACVPEPPAGTTTTVAPTTTTEPPVTYTPDVEFSSTTGLSQTGSQVVVTGTGFDPSLVAPPGPPNPAFPTSGIYVAVGVGEGPMPTAYTSAKYVRPSGPDPETNSGAKLQADGSFTATVAAPALFAGQGQAINCYIDACKVFVWSAHTGSYSPWTFSAPLSFAAPTTRQVVASKTTDLAYAGETITVTGAGFVADPTDPTPPGFAGIYLGQVPWTAENKPVDFNTQASEWGDTKFITAGSLGSSGVFRTTLAVDAVIGASNNDCTALSCSLLTVKAHGYPNPSGSMTTFTPITFAAAAG